MTRILVIQGGGEGKGSGDTGPSCMASRTVHAWSGRLGRGGRDSGGTGRVSVALLPGLYIPGLRQVQGGWILLARILVGRG